MQLVLGNSVEQIVFILPDKLSIDPNDPKYSWNNVPISVTSGPWKGSFFEGSLLTTEIKTFLSQIVPLFRDLKGGAELHSLEQWVSLEISVNLRGEVTLSGSAFDGKSTKIEFKFISDQTYFSRIPDQVEAYLSSQV